MLIEKKPTISVNDVVTIKTISGDEIIGKIVTMDDKSITLSKAVLIQMQMMSPTQAGIAFSAFLASADESSAKVRFEYSKLICDPIKPRSDISGKYTQMSTGLEIPAKGLKI